jgi:hypothetical protein
VFVVGVVGVVGVVDCSLLRAFPFFVPCFVFYFLLGKGNLNTISK